MKKKLLFSVKKVFLSLLLFFIFALPSFGQNVTIKGQVKDQRTGEPIIGASIVVKGSSLGAATDMDGNFTIVAPNQSTLQVTYLGYALQEVTAVSSKVMTILLKEDAKALEEVVVIGYGTVKKTDLTGSITPISDKDFQKGAIDSPDRLIVGKIAGVQVTSNDGMPGSGSTIRIRGTSSMTASNDPLIILDGVPLSNDKVNGSPSILSTVNPADIADMTVLKDASATAIYGSRASNGVIIINTKKSKSGQALSINFSTQASFASTENRLKLFNGDEMRNIVNTYPLSSTSFVALLGRANTDWQDQIYQTAFGTDNNLSISGAYKSLPYRVSLGYMNQEGVLKTGSMERFTGMVNLNPQFLDKHLKFDVSLKGTTMNNRYANKDAISSAAAFDPTQPVMVAVSDPMANMYGGYYTWVDKSTGLPNQQAPYNPVALLNSKDDSGTVDRFIANGQIDYSMHFLPELRAVLNLGYDYSHGQGDVVTQAWAPQKYLQGGERTKYNQEMTNTLFEFYLNYNKLFESIKSRVDFTAGYTYQDWLTHTDNYPTLRYDGTEVPNTQPLYAFDEPRNTLISFFGRLNYTYNDKYLLTATVRRDGSSRFSPDNRWGVFPSAALAWRMNEEAFLKDVEVLSNLKLRLGYGETGQQNIGYNYAYMPIYSLSSNTAMYQLGNAFYNMSRPAAYDENIKWESTTTYNAGLDYGFFKGRIDGSIDFYLKKTNDMLNTIPIPAGSNFSNELLTNIGNMENKGVEFSINANILETKDWQWLVNFNVAYNKNEITKLTQVDDPSYKGVPVGDVSGGTGTKIQMQSVGYPMNSFYMRKQIYNAMGKPIEGGYVDMNTDGKINENDLYHYKSPAPTTTFGFTTSLTFKRLTLSTILRANIGNYVFNNVASSLESYRLVMNPLSYIQNAPRSLYTGSNFYESQYLSDYFIENASFLKMDNLSLHYDFGKVFNKKVRIQANCGVQNVFTITNYTGLDPEISTGIDRNLYPRSRTFTVGLNLNF